MKALIIYDNAGFIISQMQGSDLREPIGVPFLWVEVPAGKIVTGIDLSTEEHKPVFEDLPKTETQLLQERVALAEADNITALEAIAEIYEQLMLTQGGAN